MKNKFRLFGIIALVAIMGFSMAGCDEDDDGNGNGNGNGNDTGGTFTLTGIPNQYNGKYARLYASNDNIVEVGGLNNSSDGIRNVQISNESVNIPMWTETWIGGKAQLVRYKGNHNLSGVEIRIFNTATDSSGNIAKVSFASSITFSNGSASRTWAQGTATP
jgi:hypothetical protein